MVTYNKHSRPVMPCPQLGVGHVSAQGSSAAPLASLTTSHMLVHWGTCFYSQCSKFSHWRSSNMLSTLHSHYILVKVNCLWLENILWPFYSSWQCTAQSRSSTNMYGWIELDNCLDVGHFSAMWPLQMECKGFWHLCGGRCWVKNNVVLVQRTLEWEPFFQALINPSRQFPTRAAAHGHLLVATEERGRRERFITLWLLRVQLYCKTGFESEN